MGDGFFEDRAPLARAILRSVTAVSRRRCWRRPLPSAHAARPGRPLGGGSGTRHQRRHVVHADRDRQRQPRQPDRLHLGALRWPGRAGGRRRRAESQRRARHDGRGQRRPRLRGHPVRPAEGDAGQQRQRTSRSTASGPDPAFGDVACKLGRTTGYSCGVTGDPARSPAPSSARCAVSRATPARRSRSTTGSSA